MFKDDRKISEKSTRKVNNRRKQKALSKIADDSKFKRELKGLNYIQKSKIKRQRNKLIKKDSLNKVSSSPNDKLLRKPQENGKPSVRKNPIMKKRTIKDRILLRKPKDYDLSDGSAKGSSKILRKIKTLRRRNKAKKIKKNTKRLIVLTSTPLGIGILIGLVTVFTFFLVFLGGTIVSVVLSSPNAIKEVYKSGYLGDVLTLANVKHDVVVDGKVIAKGNADATSGVFDWYGKFSDNSEGSVTTTSDSSTSTESSGTVVGTVPQDKSSFMKLSVNSDFKVNEKTMLNYFMTYSIKFKSRTDGTEASARKLMKIIKANGVSPEFFFAYELQEQGNAYGWLNHTYISGDAYKDADSVSKWVKAQANTSGTINLAWVDSANNNNQPSASVQQKGNAEASSLPTGSIGRIYLAGTAAAVWAAFAPEYLTTAYNGVQNYGDPIAGCISLLTKWQQ